MKVAQTYILCLIDYDGIGVGDVETVLYYGCTEQHVVIAPYKLEHTVLKFLRFHLAVGDAYLHVGNQAVQNLVNGREFLYLVMQEEYLSAALEFVVDDTLDFVLIEQNDLSLDGDSVGRRSVDDAEVAGAQEGELERARNRGGSKSKRVDGSADLAQLFLCRYAEFLLLVNHQQAQVFEFERIGQNLMSADEYVYLAFCQTFTYIVDFFDAAQAAYIIYRAGQVFESLGESGEVLERKDGGRN